MGELARPKNTDPCVVVVVVVGVVVVDVVVVREGMKGGDVD